MRKTRDCLKGSQLLTFLFVCFLLVPVLEIAVFIKVGSIIGLFPTIGLTIATAVAGALMVRHQGFRTLVALRDQLDGGELPVEPAIHAGFLLISGLCLLTPGFVTDCIGFLLLVPRVRLAVARALWRYVQEHGSVTIIGSRSGHSGHRGHGAPPVIDLEA